MSSAWQYALTVGPLGVYLWVLALWQSGRHPRVVRGLTDFALLAAGVGGVVAFGPIGHLAGRFLFRAPDWLDRLAIASSFGLVACGFAMRSLNRLVVYQVDARALTAALDAILCGEGGRFVRTLSGYENAAGSRGYRVEVSPRQRCAVVEAFGGDPAGLIRELRPRLRDRLAAVTCRPSPMALPLFAASVLVMFLPVLALLLTRGQARDALRVLLERFRE